MKQTEHQVPEGMGHETGARLAYAALRLGGAPEWRARTELGLTAGREAGLEALFQLRPPGKASDEGRPRFARHEPHVRAALAGGGYPVLRR